SIPHTVYFVVLAHAVKAVHGNRRITIRIPLPVGHHSRYFAGAPTGISQQSVLVPRRRRFAQHTEGEVIHGRQDICLEVFWLQFLVTITDSLVRHYHLNSRIASLSGFMAVRPC